jgi:hypothetical protein
VGKPAAWSTATSAAKDESGDIQHSVATQFFGASGNALIQARFKT